MNAPDPLSRMEALSMPGDENTLLSVRDAARQFGKNPETVRRWVWSGKLPAEKLGNQLFIKSHDLALFIRENNIDVRVEAGDEGPASGSPVAGVGPGGRADIIERMKALRQQIKTRAGELDVNALLEGTKEEY
jgi:excisionase family DNA binding protein